MAISFSVNNHVVARQGYIANSLAKQAPATGVAQAALKQTLATLGLMGMLSFTVTATGSVSTTQPDGSTYTQSYIQVLPADVTHPLYQNGNGVVVYFDSDTLLNNSFELAKVSSPINEQLCCRVLNSTGSTIAKNNIVRMAGFDATTQLTLIAKADATLAANCRVFGVTLEDIADGSQGAVMIDGVLQNAFNFVGANIGDPVYLSDTPGSAQLTTGTVGSIVGRVISAANPGTCYVRGFQVVTSATVN